MDPHGVYFGMGIPGGGEVSAAQWQAFVEEVITPRFPEGLSILPAEGQWRGADGVTLREPARLVILLHPGGERSDLQIEAIRAIYRDRFDQESVLRVDAAQKVDF